MDSKLSIIIKFFNTLHHEIEEFVPIVSGRVGIYSCGPTVYWDAHIGNMYAFTVWDVLVRFLRFEGFQVKHVMNITDVGHLTSDSDSGEDKMEKGAKRDNLTVWQVAEKYTKRFFESCDFLNIKRPDVICKATDNISEMISLIQKIEKNGYAYQILDGVYFDTSKLSNYGEMAKLNLEGQEEGARVEPVPGKKNPQDFALWKFSPKDSKRQMEWNSPWGKGFPGWHIECTAMSTKYLGENFDIHTGGKEHIPIHHTNELAQGEGAFHHNTANFWMHNNWLEIKGEKISKSLGNVYLVRDLVDKGYDPLSLRYLYLNSHYRKGVQFSFEALDAAQNALDNLRSLGCALVSEARRRDSETTYISGDKNSKREQFFQDFKAAMEDDLNFPKALAVFWSAMKSSIAADDKLDLMNDFDEVLGFRLRDYCFRVLQSHDFSIEKIPEEIQVLVQKRNELREQKKFDQADEIRKQIEEKGWRVVDEKGESKAVRIPNLKS